jgi:hypothetical protein
LPAPPAVGNDDRMVGLAHLVYAGTPAQTIFRESIKFVKVAKLRFAISI